MGSDTETVHCVVNVKAMICIGAVVHEITCTCADTRNTRTRTAKELSLVSKHFKSARNETVLSFWFVILSFTKNLTLTMLHALAVDLTILSAPKLQS